MENWIDVAYIAAAAAFVLALKWLSSVRTARAAASSSASWGWRWP